MIPEFNRNNPHIDISLDFKGGNYDLKYFVGIRNYEPPPESRIPRSIDRHLIFSDDKRLEYEIGILKKISHVNDKIPLIISVTPHVMKKLASENPELLEDILKLENT